MGLKPIPGVRAPNGLKELLRELDLTRHARGRFKEAIKLNINIVMLEKR